MTDSFFTNNNNSSSLDGYSMESCVGDIDKIYDYARVYCSSTTSNHSLSSAEMSSSLDFHLSSQNCYMSTPNVKKNHSRLAVANSNGSSSGKSLPFLNMADENKPRYSKELIIQFVQNNFSPCEQLLQQISVKNCTSAEQLPGGAIDFACHRVAKLLNQLAELQNKLSERPSLLQEPSNNNNNMDDNNQSTETDNNYFNENGSLLLKIQNMHYITWQSFYLALSKELDDAARYLRTLLEVPLCG